MRAFLALAILSLAGCATTGTGLLERPVDTAIESTKSAQALASCIADHMAGSNLRDEGGGHIVVTRVSSSVTLGRWDVYSTPSGSRAEWRKASVLTTGGHDASISCP